MRKQQSIRNLIAIICVISFLNVIHSFPLISRSNRASAFKPSGLKVMHGNEAESTSSKDSATKKSLEEKMKDWESTEEEIKEKSLGGLYVGRKSDGFDIGIALAFPVIVLIFAVFPFIMGQK